MKKKRHRFLKALAIFLAIFYAFTFMVNDCAMFAFSRQLYGANLPRQTVVLDKKSIIGRLYGTGDGVEFMCTMLVHSTLSQQELEAYYGKIKWRNARPQGSNFGNYPVDLDIANVSSGAFKPDYYKRNPIIFDYIKTAKSTDNLYYIAIHDGPYWAYLDIRGG